MAKTNLFLDARINDVWNKIHTNATGLVERFETLLRAAFHSADNPFGSVATKDVGTDSGNVPLVGASGNLASVIFPQFQAANMTGFVSPTRFPELNASKIRQATDGTDPKIDRLDPNSIPNLPASVITSGIVLDSVLPAVAQQINANSITGKATSNITLRFTGGTPGRRDGFPTDLQATGKATYRGTGSLVDGRLVINPEIPILSPNFKGETT